MFVSLGWVGTLLVAFGMTGAAIRLLRRREGPGDHFAAVARAIVLVFLLALLSLNTMVGVMGAIFWGFLGLALASQAQHRSTEAGRFTEA